MADLVPASAADKGIVPQDVSPLLAQRDQVKRIASLFVHAERALGTDQEARAFLTAPHPELDGQTPIEAAQTDLGCRRAEKVLNALEYGLAL